MDFNRYFQLIEEGKTEEAIDYRVQETPKYIYKYVSLTDPDNDSSGLNEKKLFSLKGNTIWCSPSSDQNDPFEFKGLYLDYEKLRADYPQELVDYAKQILENTFLIASFTKQMESNMPMWAHYANNHKGYCIRYLVTDRRKVIPVAYQPQRIPMNDFFRQAVKIMQEMNPDGTDQDVRTDDGWKEEYILSVLKENFFIKHDSWKQEEEFRVIYSPPAQDKLRGQNVSADELGIKIDSIYTGLNCQYHDRIKGIAQQLKVPCNQCSIDRHLYSVFSEQ